MQPNHYSNIRNLIPPFSPRFSGYQDTFLFVILKPINYTPEMSRAQSVDALLRKKFKTLELSHPWKEAFGEPEARGVWFVFGNSGNGKSTFLMQLLRELSEHGRTGYNSLEEGGSKTLQDAVKRVPLTPVQKKKIMILKESIPEMTERMLKHKGQRFMIIDSIQYAAINWNEYLKIKEQLSNKLLVIVSQVEGNKPIGRTANRIMYDADLKIWVEGMRAISKGRYIGPNGGTYEIQKNMAATHWGSQT